MYSPNRSSELTWWGHVMSRRGGGIPVGWCVSDVWTASSLCQRWMCFVVSDMCLTWWTSGLCSFMRRLGHGVCVLWVTPVCVCLCVCVCVVFLCSQDSGIPWSRHRHWSAAAPPGGRNCKEPLLRLNATVSESVQFIVLSEFPQSWTLVLVGVDRQTSTDLFVSYYRLLGKDLELLGLHVNT